MSIILVSLLMHDIVRLHSFCSHCLTYEIHINILNPSNFETKYAMDFWTKKTLSNVA